MRHLFLAPPPREGMDQAEAAKMFAQIDADGDRSECDAKLVTIFEDHIDQQTQPDNEVRDDGA